MRGQQAGSVIPAHASGTPYSNATPRIPVWAESPIDTCDRCSWTVRQRPDGTWCRFLLAVHGTCPEHRELSRSFVQPRLDGPASVPALTTEAPGAVPATDLPPGPGGRDFPATGEREPFYVDPLAEVIPLAPDGLPALQADRLAREVKGIEQVRRGAVARAGRPAHGGDGVVTACGRRGGPVTAPVRSHAPIEAVARLSALDRVPPGLPPACPDTVRS